MRQARLSSEATVPCMTGHRRIEALLARQFREPSQGIAVVQKVHPTLQARCPFDEAGYHRFALKIAAVLRRDGPYVETPHHFGV